MSGNWREQHPYAPNFSSSVLQNNANNENESSSPLLLPALYSASCFCGRVNYEVRGEPVSSKLCHCRGCQLLHGAPFEWVCIYPKGQVRFQPSSLDYLYFYSSELDRGWTSTEMEARNRILPVKVSCAHCRTPVADEGRHMWLGFGTLFGFTFTCEESMPPAAFQHSCHLFYQQRCIDLPDDKEKWTGHRLKSKKWVPGSNEM